MAKNLQKVLSGRRVCIPQPMAKKWKIDEGDVVYLEEHDRGILILPTEVKVRAR